jgi:hypothetical protein
LYVRRIPELVVEGKPLGRHVRHDPRSLAYLYPAHQVAGLTSVRHTRHIPVLDQGNLGSCTGNAAEGCVGTAAFFAAIPASNKAKPTASATSDEKQAVALYSAATKLDNAPGSYPPDDTGSDGVSVAKAAQKAGLISGYQHCTSLDSALKALSQQPVITGVNWYDSFDQPDANGLIAIASGAQVRGGHEFVVDELNVEKQLVGFTNSWGTGWGVNGRAYMSWSDFGRLLSEQGDVTVFVPVSQPAPTPIPPTPTPTPNPSDPLAELAAMLKQAIANVEAWFKKHGL